MKALCFGSINFDYIYRVDHFVGAGETISCNTLETASGGKGLNQSVALAKAGANTFFAGTVGTDGTLLVKTLQSYNVNTDYVVTKQDIRTGHAIIQNNKEGNNCILVYRGANETITSEMIDNTLAGFTTEDFLLIQNEINQVDEIITKAKNKGMLIALNPSPIRENIQHIPTEQIDYLVLNEVEGCQLTNLSLDCTGEICEKEAQLILTALKEKYPKTKIILTLGENGSIYSFKDTYIMQPSFKVTPVDTTAAGDTFMGYFIASIMQDLSIEKAMERAAKASSITVTKLGAAQSIPKI